MTTTVYSFTITKTRHMSDCQSLLQKSQITTAVTCEIKQKQNTETILKRFRIVLELFQAHYHIYSQVEKYANPETVSVVSANHQRPHTPPTMTSLMTLCNITTVNMANKFSHDHGDFIQSILLPLLICIFVRHVVTTLRHI